MQEKIYCLMNGGRSLTEEDRDVLFHTARRLYQKDRVKQAIKTDSMEGLVTTRREYSMLGATAGMKFYATLATDAGQNKVEYLVRTGHLEPKELDSGVWGFLPESVYRRLTEVGLN